MINRITQCLVLGTSLVFCACKKELRSQVQFTEPATLYSEQKNGSQRLAMTIPKGSYQVTTEVDDDELTLIFGSSSSQKFVFQIPKGKKLPESYGSLELAPVESLQTLGLRIDVDTERDESSRTRTTERCTSSRQREICGYDSSPGHHDDRGGHHGGGGYHCRTETITESGVQEVEYHYVSHSTSYSGQFFALDRRPIGQLTAGEYDSDKVYDYRGPCIPGGY